jgi:hypothetical protein
LASQDLSFGAAAARLLLPFRGAREPIGVKPEKLIFQNIEAIVAKTRQVRLGNLKAG